MLEPIIPKRAIPNNTPRIEKGVFVGSGSVGSGSTHKLSNSSSQALSGAISTVVKLEVLAIP